MLAFLTSVKFKLFVLAVLMAGSVYTGWLVRDYGAVKEKAAALILQAQQVEAEIKRRRADEKKFHAASVELENQLQALRAKKNDIRVVREYAKPVYTACVMPADGMRLISEAVTTVNASRSR